MTPRVGRTTISLTFAGLIVIIVATAVCHLTTRRSRLGASRRAASPTWLFIVVWLTHLRREYSHRNEGNRAAVITAATWMTLGRGFLVIALVAGFVLGPRPVGRALWLPGAAYVLAVLADGGDGALARWTDRVTALGAKLDVTTDAVGLFVAPVVGVRWGRLPPWYLALALAYPTFWLAIRLRRARALPLHLERLRRDPRARFFAGAQMILVATALLPVLPRAFTWAAATAAMLPTLALFAGEWRLVTRDV